MSVDEIVRARIEDIAVAWDIVARAKEDMRLQGRTQWQDSYPSEENLTADINAGNGYLLKNDGSVCGYGAVIFSGEPAYDKIDGEWLGSIPYVVVHRLAVNPALKGKGLATVFLQLVEKLALEKGFGSIRIDTNFDNAGMLCVVQKCGFTYCGKVRLPGGERLAFEKLI